MNFPKTRVRQFRTGFDIFSPSLVIHYQNLIGYYNEPLKMEARHWSKWFVHIYSGTPGVIVILVIRIHTVPIGIGIPN